MRRMNDPFPEIDFLKKLLRMCHKIVIQYMRYRIENDRDDNALDIELARLAVCLETTLKDIDPKMTQVIKDYENTSCKF